MIRFGSTHIQISAYTYHYGDRGAYDNSISDRGNLLLGTSAAHTQPGSCAGRASLASSRRRPPAAKPLPHRWPWWKGNFPSWPSARRAQTDSWCRTLSDTQRKKKGAVDAALTLRCSSPAWPQRTTEPVYCSLILTSEIKHILILSINLIIH